MVGMAVGKGTMDFGNFGMNEDKDRMLVAEERKTLDVFRNDFVETVG